MESLGDKIERIRKAQGIGIRELSADSGISRVTLWKIRTGRQQSVRTNTLRTIAEALNIPPSVLL